VAIGLEDPQEGLPFAEDLLEIGTVHRTER
jgi:hypothetical protein